MPTRYPPPDLGGPFNTLLVSGTVGIGGTATLAGDETVAGNVTVQGTVTGPLHDKGGHTFNVRAYGHIGHERIVYPATAALNGGATATVITTTIPQFTPADVGKSVRFVAQYAPNAGGEEFYSQLLTVASYQSNQQITLSGIFVSVSGFNLVTFGQLVFTGIDDTPVFMQAYQAALAAGGGIIEIDPLFCFVSTLPLAPHVHWVGAGNATHLMQIAATPKTVFDVDVAFNGLSSIEDCSVESLSMDAIDNPMSLGGIHWIGVRRSLLNHVTMQGMYTYCVGLESTGLYATQYNNIVGCDFEMPQRGAYVYLLLSGNNGVHYNWPDNTLAWGNFIYVYNDNVVYKIIGDGFVHPTPGPGGCVFRDDVFCTFRTNADIGATFNLINTDGNCSRFEFSRVENIDSGPTVVTVNADSIGSNHFHFGAYSSQGGALNFVDNGVNKSTRSGFSESTTPTVYDLLLTPTLRNPKLDALGATLSSPIRLTLTGTETGQNAGGMLLAPTIVGAVGSGTMDGARFIPASMTNLFTGSNVSALFVGPSTVIATQGINLLNVLRVDGQGLALSGAVGTVASFNGIYIDPLPAVGAAPRNAINQIGTSDNNVFSGPVFANNGLFLADGKNIGVLGSTGMKIGTAGGAAGQKLGFFNAAPVLQVLLATGAAHTVDDVITALQSLGLFRQT